MAEQSAAKVAYEQVKHSPKLDTEQVAGVDGNCCKDFSLFSKLINNHIFLLANLIFSKIFLCTEFWKCGKV